MSPRDVKRLACVHTYRGGTRYVAGARADNFVGRIIDQKYFVNVALLLGLQETIRTKEISKVDNTASFGNTLVDFIDILLIFI